MASHLRNLVARAPAHPDIMVALMLLLAIGMMIMPIPIIVIDMLYRLQPRLCHIAADGCPLSQHAA
ncbi:type III secretory pathway component EscV [Bradyrhizobium elkanii]